MRFYTVTQLVTELLEKREDRQLKRLLLQLESQDLLILDELGYVPFTKVGAELLFDVVGRAYERQSLIVTSNLPFEHWVEILGNERLTGALLDLMLIRAEVLQLFEYNKLTYIKWLSEEPQEGSDAATKQDLIQKALRNQWEIEPVALRDDELSACRDLASRNYRNALNSYLGEINDYLKRYRFPNEAYLVHGNLMDRQMHYDICESVRLRHWNYFDPEKGGKKGSETAEKLYEKIRQISECLFEPLPVTEDDTEWYAGITRLRDLVREMGPCDRTEVDSGPRTADSQMFDFTKKTEKDGLDRFFRSYDDGLHREPEPKQKPKE